MSLLLVVRMIPFMVYVFADDVAISVGQALDSGENSEYFLCALLVMISLIIFKA